MKKTKKYNSLLYVPDTDTKADSLDEVASKIMRSAELKARYLV